MQGRRIHAHSAIKKLPLLCDRIATSMYYSYAWFSVTAVYKLIHNLQVVLIAALCLI